MQRIQKLSEAYAKQSGEFGEFYDSSYANVSCD